MTEVESKPIVYLLVGLASIVIITAGIKASAFILNPILLATVITIPDDKDDEHQAALDKMRGLWVRQNTPSEEKKQLTKKYQRKQRR